MVGAAGFEPATPWSQARCSTKLSHAPISGAVGGTWTHTTRDHYPLKVARLPIPPQPHCLFNWKMVAAKRFELLTLRVWTECSSQLSYAAIYNGADNQSWTGDLILTKDALYLLSYISMITIGCGKRTRTSDLRVMSPTSYLLLHPAIIKAVYKKYGGQGWIRTIVAYGDGFTVRSL